ncbi:MAG: Hpt domain-containing protein [Lachnospiraceae bacterium]|nr:Hpt domain-containing protein [Lachnospiraceae bacterium]
MSFDINSLKEIGLDVKLGVSYTGNNDKYVSALQRFYKNFEKNKNNVETFFAEKDYENYMITVHALKSNAKMIGATELSEKFEALETAAKNNDVETIEKDTYTTLASYRALVLKLQPVGEMEEVHAADEISSEVAKETVEKLLEALDDFDDDLSKELVIKLSGYPFRMTQKELLKNAKEQIEDFMYDEAAEIIREIAKTIE